MFTMWYWVGEGATEGYTWSTSERRHGNYIIRPGIHDSPLFKTAQGRWCYHTWRVMGENVGMFGSVIMYVWLAHQGYALQGLLFDYMGATMAGIFFYERVFNHISYNDLWPQKSSWDVLNGWIIVPRAVWQDFVLLIVGIAFVVL